MNSFWIIISLLSMDNIYSSRCIVHLVRHKGLNLCNTFDNSSSKNLNWARCLWLVHWLLSINASYILHNSSRDKDLNSIQNSKQNEPSFRLPGFSQQVHLGRWSDIFKAQLTEKKLKSSNYSFWELCYNSVVRVVLSVSFTSTEEMMSSLVCNHLHHVW